ncbi:neural/ectodermal development factor IMP-L2 [Bicyclus anynana]|uniref:Neural/ectodermal development factor IMP-L2 n=1 Tax=Bicyclus anynana TaxID=110368 RepID=A0A6J1N3R0_BICAN|nr:neural/ectodermal development factor IMP-L2 [Bicyclus anynana]XP_023941520.2 neural/ectodermal development factor IMP-L2 [Bicyclus anynana]
MINIVPLLAAVAIVSLQGTNAFARLDKSSSLELDNKLLPNDLSDLSDLPAKRRAVENYIKISTPPPKTARYVPGTTLLLECEIMGSPAPFVEWLKNGVPVTDGEDEEFVPVDQLSPAFLSSRHVVRSAANGDVYTCVGSSSANVVSASTTVFVDGDASETRINEVTPPKPIVTAYYTDLLLNIGSPATLLCRGYSATPSHTMWMDNQNRIVNDNSRIRVLPSGDLYIKSVEWPDMGVWTCSVKNAYGREAVGTFLYPMAVRARV